MLIIMAETSNGNYTVEMDADWTVGAFLGKAIESAKLSNHFVYSVETMDGIPLDHTRTLRQYDIGSASVLRVVQH